MTQLQFSLKLICSLVIVYTSALDLFCSCSLKWLKACPAGYENEWPYLLLRICSFEGGTPHTTLQSLQWLVSSSLRRLMMSSADLMTVLFICLLWYMFGLSMTVFFQRTWCYCLGHTSKYAYLSEMTTNTNSIFYLWCPQIVCSSPKTCSLPSITKTMSGSNFVGAFLGNFC